MEERKKLIVMISDIPTHHGVMTVNFALSHFGSKHPNEETTISIFELLPDESIRKLYERINGKWMTFFE